jgi:hypothetical protein
MTDLFIEFGKPGLRGARKQGLLLKAVKQGAIPLLAAAFYRKR